MNLQTRKMFIGILLVIFAYLNVFNIDLNSTNNKTIDLILFGFKILFSVYWVYIGVRLIQKSLEKE